MAENLEEAEWDRVQRDRGQPSEIDEATFSADNGLVHLPALIVELFGGSRSDARRLISQGGVTLDDKPVEAVDVSPTLLDGRVLRVGKRRFRRLRLAA